MAGRSYDSYLVGEKFGMLTFLEFIGRRPGAKGYKIFWRCRCDCGNEREFDASNVVGGNSRSCGRCRRNNKGSTKERGMANARHTFGGCRNGAKARGLEFGLTFDAFLVTTQQNCYYCGAAPTNVTELRHKDGTPRCNGPFVYNGIDRKDNSVGYVLDNIVPCCGRCNWSKGTLSAQEFIDMATAIAAMNGKR